MEFFTDSYESAYSENTSSVHQSRLSDDDRNSRSGWGKKSKAEDSKGFHTSEEYTG